MIEKTEHILSWKTVSQAIIVIFATVLTHAAQAEIPTDNISDSTTQPHTSGFGGDVEILLDGILEAQLRVYKIPGAALSLVKDGEIVLAKGYGTADLRSGRSIQPDKTLFRIGSVSKLFTWTAVMQLVEQGKLDLHADINTYLFDVTIPRTFPEPPTLAHLMTHTAGFESRFIGLFIADYQARAPLVEYLSKRMPARLRRPGEVTAYSNYGAALAGYIVEHVSGIRYEDYVEQNILNPLGMQHTTFLQPPPQPLATDLAMGYGNALKPGATEIIQAVPAGAMSATAWDMAKFMIAHLQQGHYGGSRILEENTAREMHRRQFTNDERVSGWTFGFEELWLNNQRILWHPGDTRFFSTGLYLIPKYDVGLFVSYNHRAGSQARADLIQAFMDHRFPGCLLASTSPGS